MVRYILLEKKLEKNVTKLVTDDLYYLLTINKYFYTNKVKCMKQKNKDTTERLASSTVRFYKLWNRFISLAQLNKLNFLI